MIKVLAQIFLGVAISLPLAAQETGPTGDPDFDFYFTELIVQELQPEDPMIALIEDGLIEAAFNAESDTDFKYRLRLIQQLAEDYPDKLPELWSFDRRLQHTFEDRLDRAKTKRLIYAAGGAVIGVAVSIPVGKLIGKTWKSLWISIPVGAASGAGFGFLLGHLTQMPRFTYESGLIRSDLEFNLDEIDELMETLE